MLSPRWLDRSFPFPILRGESNATLKQPLLFLKGEGTQFMLLLDVSELKAEPLGGAESPQCVRHVARLNAVETEAGLV